MSHPSLQKPTMINYWVAMHAWPSPCHTYWLPNACSGDLLHLLSTHPLSSRSFFPPSLPLSLFSPLPIPLSLPPSLSLPHLPPLSLPSLFPPPSSLPSLPSLPYLPTFSPFSPPLPSLPFILLSLSLPLLFPSSPSLSLNEAN